MSKGVKLYLNTSWSANDNIHAPPQSIFLGTIRSSTIDANGAQPNCISICLKIGVYLNAQKYSLVSLVKKYPHAQTNAVMLNHHEVCKIPKHKLCIPSPAGI